MILITHFEIVPKIILDVYLTLLLLAFGFFQDSIPSQEKGK